MTAGLLAALIVGLGQLLGRRGVDLAASVYRVDSFRHDGFRLWDFQWFGGHWTLDYSILYPPLAGTVGIAVTAVLSAGVAALAFDGLARRHLGPGARPASLVFAAGTLVTSAIGQMPFLAGEAFGLAALWCLDRRARSSGAPAAPPLSLPVALVLALASSLCSPLSGAFDAMCAAAWWLGSQAAVRRSRLFPAGSVAAAALAPVLVSALVFPGQGAMPYPLVDWAWEVAVAAALWLMAGGHRVIRAGAALWLVVATVAVAVPSPLGGNIGRIEDVAALPLAVALAWARPRVLLLAAAAPLVLSEWGPAWGALTTIPEAASTNASFYAPLQQELGALAAAAPAGRVEVVPTAYHWEADFVAGTAPLARGWERQLDEADNPLFYRPDSLTPGTYHQWLVDNGVRFVALPSAPLDVAGRAEGNLVRSGVVPGLRLIWRSPDWRLYSVVDSPGIVSGPARLVSAADGRLVIDVSAAAPLEVRVRYTPDWVADGGSACVSRTSGDWLEVSPRSTGLLTLRLSLLGRGSQSCAGVQAEGARR